MSFQSAARHSDAKAQPPGTLPRVSAGELLGRHDDRTGPSEHQLSPDARASRGLVLPPHSTWDRLRPRGFYARVARPLIQYGALLAALPLLLAVGLPIAAINWVQFGSARRILFAQERIGYRGRKFTIYKFRTMREARDGGNFESWACGGEKARVTRFGQFLRNSHLDELPQLLHVFTGQMSIIGPRPEMVEIEEWVAQHQPEFILRMAVKPGITGLGQVAQGYVGADETGYRRKHELAMRYLEGYGFRMDTYIVLKTLGTMVALKGWNLKPLSPEAREAHRPAASRMQGAEAEAVDAVRVPEREAA
jgi:lipopolysaccharide/colanic/teichoic acid biosynthesis glycosyltransferase